MEGQEPRVEALYNVLTDFFAHYGYWVIFFGVMLENGGVPLPGETILLFAGFLAYHGEINLVRAMATAAAGATIGDSLGFCPRFLFFNFTGAVLWSLTIGSVGFLFGGSLPTLVHVVKRFHQAVFAAAVLAIAVWVWFYLKRRHAKRRAPSLRRDDERPQ
ncbi:MAG: hypothetical protein DMG22_06050 [Acidobacteria bacterium]|nr:MAG: hypothetical protein DMG22_06050 [Acidobacteriota bacterium]